MARPLLASRQTITLLQAFLEAPDRWRYGYDLSRHTALKPGTLYPLLIRLDGLGWLETQWSEPSEGGRPQRHLHRLNGLGFLEATARVEADRVKNHARLAAVPLAEGAT